MRTTVQNWAAQVRAGDVRAISRAVSGIENRASEAESLLNGGYEGLMARQAEIPARRRVDLTTAGSRIVAFYDAWGKRDLAAHWRKQLALPASTAPPKL